MVAGVAHNTIRHARCHKVRRGRFSLSKYILKLIYGKYKTLKHRFSLLVGKYETPEEVSHQNYYMVTEENVPYCSVEQTPSTTTASPTTENSAMIKTLSLALLPIILF